MRFSHTSWYEARNVCILHNATLPILSNANDIYTVQAFVMDTSDTNTNLPIPIFLGLKRDFKVRILTKHSLTHALYILALCHLQNVYRERMNYVEISQVKSLKMFKTCYYSHLLVWKAIQNFLTFCWIILYLIVLINLRMKYNITI